MYHKENPLKHHGLQGSGLAGKREAEKKRWYGLECVDCGKREGFDGGKYSEVFRHEAE